MVVFIVVLLFLVVCLFFRKYCNKKPDDKEGVNLRRNNIELSENPGDLED